MKSRGSERVMDEITDDDIWAESWLARTYGGAPDECGECFRAGEIVKSADCTKHTQTNEHRNNP